MQNQDPPDNQMGCGGWDGMTVYQNTVSAKESSSYIKAHKTSMYVYCTLQIQ